MQAYVPLGEKKPSTFRVSSGLLTALLLVNAAAICVFLCCMNGSAALGSPLAVRARASPLIGRVRTRAAITSFDDFKRDIDAKYPENFAMKADGLYSDYVKQMEEKIKYLEAETSKLDAKTKTPEDLAAETATVDRGFEGVLATVLLASLPLATIAGLVLGLVVPVNGE
eukprot:CAMPEP_0167753802 /NCGR_PEP_ID=MMETSP0110_2-20121227/7916_1 /TAXON_ID=629695 /ORGANISM="Gymnochlora sp., Strain CCMP2014" /LENGTH=168 /DNA_ID=CAMNT_0007639609 /DNA_START=553 /DNA_END=1059 /DNA_ORIENTATION=+